MDKDNPVIARLIAWGEKHDAIRAIILSSLRANPSVQYLVDPLSDYDLDIVIQGDARSWYEDRSWLQDYGRLLVGFVEPPAEEYGIEDFGCVILYEDGTKIDYTIMPVEIFRQVVAEPILRGGWDDGYQILLDKDHMAAGLKPPTHKVATEVGGHLGYVYPYDLDQRVTGYLDKVSKLQHDDSALIA